MQEILFQTILSQIITKLSFASNHVQRRHSCSRRQEFLEFQLEDEERRERERVLRRRRRTMEEQGTLLQLRRGVSSHKAYPPIKEIAPRPA